MNIDDPISEGVNEDRGQKLTIPSKNDKVHLFPFQNLNECLLMILPVFKSSRFHTHMGNAPFLSPFQGFCFRPITNNHLDVC